MTVTVETGARLHFGFVNMVPGRGRLFQSLGVGVDRPVTRISVDRAASVECGDPEVAAFARDAVAYLDVPGAAVTIEDSPPRHAGFGSGTQLALTTLAAIAVVYGCNVDVRDAAPALGRARRSGVGVATFERGGFIFDAGRDQAADRGEGDDCSWTVPPVILDRPLPPEWRFVTVLPAVERGLSGDEERAGIEHVMAAANPAIGDRIAAIVAARLLPALATADARSFGHALSRIDGLNGRWFEAAQSDAYHPAVGPVVSALQAAPAIFGVGQSSWGPAVYGFTTADRVDAAESAARDALARAAPGGDVYVMTPRNEGAAILAGTNSRRTVRDVLVGEDPEWTD